MVEKKLTEGENLRQQMRNQWADRRQETINKYGVLSVKRQYKPGSSSPVSKKASFSESKIPSPVKTPSAKKRLFSENMVSWDCFFFKFEYERECEAIMW